MNKLLNKSNDGSQNNSHPSQQPKLNQNPSNLSRQNENQLPRGAGIVNNNNNDNVGGMVSSVGQGIHDDMHESALSINSTNLEHGVRFPTNQPSQRPSGVEVPPQMLVKRQQAQDRRTHSVAAINGRVAVEGHFRNRVENGRKRLTNQYVSEFDRDINSL